MIISTWFYSDSITEKSKHPQFCKSSASREFQDLFWKNVVVFYATSLKFNKNYRHFFFTNVENLPKIRGLDLNQFFSDNRIKILRSPFKTFIPTNDLGFWKNQFYIFDILSIFNKSVSNSNEILLLLDSDCVWNKSADSIFKKCASDGLLGYRIDYDPGRNVNGLSRIDLKQIIEDFQDKNLKEPPKYYGGEFFCSSKENINKILDSLTSTIPLIEERKKKGELVFETEEHLFSYLYFLLGYQKKHANQFIKRMWTCLFAYNNITDSDLDLNIWHLPYEKNYGILRLFNYVKNQNSEFWYYSGEEFRKFLRKILGVPKRSGFKFALDFVRASKSKLLKFIR